MTTDQIKYVKDSWSLVVPNAQAVGQVFYTNLFTIDPSLRAMFPTSMAEQEHKLMMVLTLLVSQLENTDTVVRELTSLARRHVRYGVKPAHYATVGQALLQTLGEGLGTHWTPNTQLAWTTLYQTVSSVMIAAAEPVEGLRASQLQRPKNRYR